jgi:hypothetical protein
MFGHTAAPQVTISKPSLRIREVILGLVAALGPVVLLIIAPACELLVKNRDQLGYGIAPARWLFLVGLCCWGFGTVLTLLPERRSSNWVSTTYLLLGPGWMIYWSIFGFTGALFGFVLAVLLFPPIAGALFRNAQRRSILVIFSVLSVAFTIPVAPILLRVLEAEEAITSSLQSTSSTSRKLPNVYHVVFDEFQSNYLAEGLHRSVAESLSGFMFFPDATTPFGRTEMALSSVFAGMDYDYRSAPIQYMWSAFFDDKISLLQNLKKAGYYTEGYLHIRYPSIKQTPFDSAVYHTKQPQLLRDADTRANVFASLWAYGSFPPQISKLIIPSIYWKQLTDGVLLPTQAPLISLNSVYRFLEVERSRPDHGRYVFLHLILPHFPHVLDTNCVSQGEKLVGAAAQHGCAVKVMQDFIKRLKELGRFDSSLVIFQGDHGVGYDQSSDIFSLPFVEGRSRPLLLIKKPNTTASTPLTISQVPATMLDIAPTIVDALKLEPWINFAGDSLLDGNVPARPTRTYHMYNKDQRMITDGKMRRYKLDQNGWQFDQEISVPQAGARSLPIQ